mmetsp:Transcript_3823/g.8771  ORF Transcript_3823/g.8771 Transcript_3823/m.8771 type:complete len:236 (+) Transcript_3823:30-737(+)
MVQLDDVVLARVLAFNQEPKARVCCRAWDTLVYECLQLEHRIGFHKEVHKTGSHAHHHHAVRSMGGDFEECVAYQFEFHSSGKFTVQWNRSFGQWSAANERQVGRWAVDGNMLRCVTEEGPPTSATEVMYAPAGRCFALPVALALSGRSVADDVAHSWEFEVRGSPVPEIAVFSEAEGPSDQPGAPAVGIGAAAEDARFVEIDGELREVAADIRDRYPEEDWARLMGCRIRWGLC